MASHKKILLYKFQILTRPSDFDDDDDENDDGDDDGGDDDDGGAKEGVNMEIAQ